MNRTLQKKVLCLSLAVLLMLPPMVSAIPSAHAATLPFTDVPATHTCYDAISYVYNEGIMQGISSTQFAPEMPMNRAMMVTLLYRISGSAMQRNPSGFTDLSASSYYWAGGSITTL